VGIQIIITDPTPREARAAADALLALHGNHGEKETPRPEQVFGAACSTAAAVVPSIAPVAAPVTSATPTPPVAVVPLVPTPESAAQVVAPTAASPANGVELDVNGLPWDARIHAGSREKIKAGSWKYRRGVEEHIIASVEAELRQAMAVPANPTVAQLAVIATPSPTSGAAFSVVPAPPVAPSGMDFPTLMQKITAAKVAGTITQEHVDAAVVAVGLPALAVLPTRPDLIPQIAASLGLN